MSGPEQPVFLYVVDTSFLIEVHKRYPEKTLPGIWKDIETLIREGRIVAPEYVKSEINRQDDDLKDWVNDHGEMFESISPELLATTGIVVNRFTRTAHAMSLKPGHADPFVIGLAMKLGKTRAASSPGRLLSLLKKRASWLIILTSGTLRSRRSRMCAGSSGFPV